jgi:hypothetical protein
MTLEQRLDFMKAMAEAGMPETLASLKRDAESTPNRQSDAVGVPLAGGPPSPMVGCLRSVGSRGRLGSRTG